MALKKTDRMVIMIFCVLIFLAAAGAVFAEETAKTSLPKVIRVGWYKNKNFQEMDPNGYRRGYEYEYLQEMARYGGWRYEYVNGSREECLKMLQEGRVDIVGGLFYTETAARSFDFVKYETDETYTILAVNAKDGRYTMDGWEGFDGMRIGVIPVWKNHLYKLHDYAAERGILFTTADYKSIDELERALKGGDVDAILMGEADIIPSNTKIIAQFAPSKRYFVTRLGGGDMKNALIFAMEQIRRFKPDFKAQLEKKYLEDSDGIILAFTEEEARFLKETPTLRVTLPSFRKPMMYKENGEYRGIAIDILKELEARLGVRFEYIEALNQLEAVKMVSTGSADILSNIYYDYGWAEKNELLLSRPYLDLDYAAITRIDYIQNSGNPKAAAVKGYLFSQNYVQKNYREEEIAWYNSEEECVDAVRNGEADICFVNSYVAGTYLQNYKYKNLYASVINYSHGLSLSLPHGGRREMLLMSVLDKGISAIGKNKTSAIIAVNTMVTRHTMSAGEIIMRYPMISLSAAGISVAVIVSVLAIYVIIRNNRRKNIEVQRAEQASQRDTMTGLYNRSYFESEVSARLGAEENHEAAFLMIDLDDFKMINDTLGHLYGDHVLILFAAKMREVFGTDNLLCRMGGDEFAAFLPRIKSYQEVLALAEALKASFIKDIGGRAPSSCSIGISLCPEDGRTFNDLYRAADSALYAAKKSGKGKISAA